jgi:hypothetical protein
MSLALLLLLACRPGEGGPAPVPTPLPTPGTPGTPPTGDTALTETATTTLPTANTGLTLLHTADTGTTIPTPTGDTALQPTAGTGDTAPLTDTCGRPIASTQATATGSTADTGACGVFPKGYPVDTAPPPIADTGLDCPTDTATPAACPELAWILHLPGDTDAWLDDLDTFPNGDLLVAGSDERGVTFHEGEPNEFRVPEICPGLPATPFVARIDPDGQLVWAMRPVDGCELVKQESVVVNASGSFATYGTFASDFNQTVTFGPSSPNSFVHPPPAGHSDIWLAAFDDGGELLHGHVVSGPETAFLDESIDAIALADDGTLYAAGKLRGEVTIDPQEAWATRLYGAPQPTDDPNAREIWLAAWNADGSLRWARTDATGGKGTGIPQALHPDGDDVVLYADGANEVLWDACGPHETAQQFTGDSTPRAILRYAAATGITRSHRTDPHSPNEVWTAPFGFIFEDFADDALAVGDTIVPKHRTYVPRYGTTCDRYVGVTHSADSDIAMVVRDIAVSDDYLLLAGRATFSNDVTEFTCGPALPSPSSLQWEWYLLQADGHPVCGAAIQVTDDYRLTDYGAALDDGGLYFSSSWVGTGRVAEGTAHEIEIDTTTGDLLIFRYTW